MSDAPCYIAHTEQELSQIAEDLKALLKEGSLIALEGSLGTGKSTLVKYLLQALGYTGETHSPTFAKMHEYDTESWHVHHLDFYRESIDFWELQEILNKRKSIVLIEWFSEAPYATEVEDLVSANISIETLLDSDTRRIYLTRYQ